MTGVAQDSLLTNLLNAAGKGDAAAVAAILDAHPHLIDQRGTLPGSTGRRTALHFGSGHEAVVRTLLQRGADPNIRDEGDNAFPLHFAAEGGDLNIVKLLIAHGADPVGSGTTHELDALGWAVCFDYAMQLEVAEYLLAHGARHTLMSAVAMGDVEAIRALGRAGADLNQHMDRTNRRRTPLHLAIVKNQPAALAALIELGANVDLKDATGLTPLDQSALADNRQMTQQLLDAGATLTLPAAIVLEREDDVERLLGEQREAFSTTDNRRWARLLVYASGRASARVLHTLLRAIVKRHRAGLTLVNMADDEETAADGTTGYTPLHAAAFHGNDDAVRILLEAGANPRARDGKYCGTPAGWAAYAGHARTADLILEAGIDIFDAIQFDRADLVSRVLDIDPGALDRRFKAYASCPTKDGQWWPQPECTPLEWATTQKKDRAARALIERGAGTRTEADIARADRVATFLQLACWDHHEHGKSDHRMSDRAAQKWLAQEPTLAQDSLYTAVVCGDRNEVARLLATEPDVATIRGGPRGWTPILYLAYTRFTHPPTLQNALAIGQMLLDHGANPNDFYMAGDSSYTALVGVAAEGEQDAPRQPYAAELFALLLARGAEPFDIQVLYNTHFSGEILWWLELVYKHTINAPRAAAWSDPDWAMFDMGNYGSGARFLLEIAIKKRNVALARWVLTHGANPNAAPARDTRFPKHSLYEFAVLEGVMEIAELLVAHGATVSAPTLEGDERFLYACLHLNRDEVKRLVESDPAYRQSPAAMFEAAARDRVDALSLLVDLGVDVNVQDRTGKRALHEAAFHGSLRAARFLIEHGAEVDADERTYNSPPIGWASHSDRSAIIDYLSGYSRHIWTLCFRGYVDRVRELLRESPELARLIGSEGETPLWWLPDDEAQALAIVELLLAAGADPAKMNIRGRTAADWALRRGLTAVAARLTR